VPHQLLLTKAKAFGARKDFDLEPGAGAQERRKKTREKQGLQPQKISSLKSMVLTTEFIIDN
jgi:hypothetical protein